MIRFKPAIFSSIRNSHKSCVMDVKWMPPNVKVDRRNPGLGEVTHLVSCAEDGLILIWDARNVMKEARREHSHSTRDFIWDPNPRVQLYKVDGSGEFGIT